MSSNVVEIGSTAQFASLLKSSRVVIADFYATWCQPCKVIAPVFESIAEELSVPGAVTFVKINTEEQPDIASQHSVRAMPTFILFRDSKVIDRVQGANPAKLQALVQKIVTEASASGSASGSGSGSGAFWYGASIPRGYSDITSNIEIGRTELLNVDDSAGAGAVRVLFDGAAPSGKEEKPATGTADWVESDTDEQLMLFIPLQTNAKLHTLQITSHATEEAARPRVIKLYSNNPHNLGFDEAEDMQATQEIELSEADWNDTATASIPLKFVKFQNATTLVVFVVSAADDADKVRLDRVRLIGESGEKREMGKLEKIGDEQGE